jgi:hypothetical protein
MRWRVDTGCWKRRHFASRIQQPASGFPYQHRALQKIARASASIQHPRTPRKPVFQLIPAYFRVIFFHPGKKSASSPLNAD